jgi:ParB-like chromosome segregation protein Spo0J
MSRAYLPDHIGPANSYQLQEKNMTIEKRSRLQQPANHKIEENGIALGQAAPNSSGAPSSNCGVVIHVPIADLQSHPIADRIPLMPDDQLKEFEADVEKVGVKEPIVILSTNEVVDGRHRLVAAKKRGDKTIPATVVDWSDDEIIENVYRAAIHRRHLTDDQRAMLAAEWAKDAAAQSRRNRARSGGKAGGRKRPKSSDSSAANVGAELSKSPPLRTDEASGAKPKRKERAVDQAAEKFGVSSRKVRNASKLIKESPEQAEDVRAGKVKLAKARRDVANTKAAETGKRHAEPPTKRECKFIESVIRFAETKLGTLCKPNRSLKDLAAAMSPKMRANCQKKLESVRKHLEQLETAFGVTSSQINEK